MSDVTALVTTNVTRDSAVTRPVTTRVSHATYTAPHRTAPVVVLTVACLSWLRSSFIATRRNGERFGRMNEVSRCQ